MWTLVHSSLSLLLLSLRESREDLEKTMSVLYPPSSSHGREKQLPSIKHHSGKTKFFQSNLGVYGWHHRLSIQVPGPHNIQLPMMTKLCTSFTYLILGKEICNQAGKLYSKEPPVLRNYQLRLKYLFCLDSSFFFNMCMMYHVNSYSLSLH